MSTKPHLSQRSITAYNRLCREVVALNYLVRIAKPAGTLGEVGRSMLGGALRTANRLYRREAGLPGFGRISPTEVLTVSDVALIVARLTTAGITFEERYAHLTEEGAEEAERQARSAALVAQLDATPL